jgi:hypothetical protein
MECRGIKDQNGRLVPLDKVTKASATTSSKSSSDETKEGRPVTRHVPSS